ARHVRRSGGGFRRFVPLPVLATRGTAVVADRLCYRLGTRRCNGGQILRRVVAACPCRLLSGAEADKKPFHHCRGFPAGHRSGVSVFVLSSPVLPEHAFRQCQPSEKLSVLRSEEHTSELQSRF